MLTPVLWILSNLALASQGSELARNPIGNFHVVVAGEIYRGELPGKAGMEYLAAAGFKAVLNLKTEDDSIEEEARVARELGLTHVSVPLSPVLPLRDRDVNSALEALANPALHPIFVHCRHGRDRTGLVVGLDRVERQGWSATRAYDEMLDRGFRSHLIFLDRYFKDRVGLRQLASLLTTSSN